MWLLGTDHLSILERGGNTALSLQMRLGQVSLSEVDTTIVNYEEQMRGWLSKAARASTPEKIVGAYALLQVHVETSRDFLLLPFDKAASDQFIVDPFVKTVNEVFLRCENFLSFSLFLFL